MRVLLYSHSYAPLVGGIPAVAEMVEGYLRLQGAKVTVATTTPSPSQGPEGRPVLRGLSWRGLCRAAALHDLLHVNGMSVRAVLAARRAGVPVVVTHQSYNAALPRSPGELRALVGEEGFWRLAHAATSAVVMHLADRNVCISEYVRARNRPPRAVVLPNPVAACFRPRPELPASGRFAFVGRLVGDKGADVLLQALAECAGHGRHFGADLYGDGPERSRLEALAATLGLAEQVRFCGPVQGAALAEAYVRSLAVVVPSRWQEPLGIVALEAMACGRAVIASAGGGLGEVVRGLGLVFPNGDVKTLAACLERMADDWRLRQECERAGLARARDFALAEVGRAYLELFDQVLAERGHHARAAPPASKPAVVVAHPGTQHSYQTALALQRAGMLERYFTGFYFDPESTWWRAVRVVTNGSRARVERELRRRYCPELDAQRIRTSPTAELMHLGSARLRPLRPFTSSLLRWRNERFDRWVAGELSRALPRAVLSYDTSALRTFTAARRLGIRCVLDQTIGHLRAGLELLREEAERHPEFADTLPLNVPDGLIERCTAEALAADCVLAPSDYVRGTLLPIGVPQERIHLLPYGADLERFAPAPPREDGVFRILFVGHLSQRKGIKYLLEAFRRLRLPCAELLLVGEVAGSGAGLARYRGVFRHVSGVPGAAVPTWFRQADLFVYPSLHEGSALAIYEALAAGLPVVTTPNSGSVVRDGVEGFVVPIRDVEALQERILVLYHDRELRRAMSWRARIRAEQFSWTVYGDRLAGVLRQTAEDRA